MKYKTAIWALTALTVTSPLMAVSVQRVTVGNFDDFAQGEPLSATLTQPGVLKPGATLQEIFDLKDLNIWSGVADAAGDLYVGTGPRGEVFRVHEGEATQVAKFEENDVYAVARNAAGEIFAASSPKGKIYRFADGHAEEYFDTSEEYVWDLLFDADGNLYAATGGKGKIFKITDKGKGEVWYASDEPNIRCLAFDKTGHLLAGTSGKGLLYRVTAKDQAVVLLQAAYAEITAITVSGDTIYAAATGKRDLKSAPAPATTITVSGTNGGEAVRAMAAAISARAASAGTSATTSAPTGNDKSVLYRLQRDLYPEIVARADNSIYSLAPTRDGILIGTGGTGKLYRLNPDEQLELIGKVEAKDITRLLPRADSDQLTVLTSNLAKGHTLSLSGGAGEYQSKVFDTGLFAQWGALEVTGSGKWRVQTRSGNTENPDKSWYPWIGLKNAHSQSPPARYTQFKLTVSEGEVWRVEFAYLPQNQPPTLSAIVILPPGLGSKEMPTPVNSGPRTTNLDQLLKGGPVTPPAQPSQYQLSNIPGWRTVAWKATDPNGDTLQYQVEIRAEAQRDWDVLAEKLDKSIFSWDASGWADGNYYIRVTADDAPDNKQGKSHTAQKTSEVFQIDNTPPKITVLAQDDEYVDIRVTDALSRIGSVRISTNARDYAEVQPKDGLTDSRQEEYRVKREKDQPLYIRAIDAAGNVAGLRVGASEHSP